VMHAKGIQAAQAADWLVKEFGLKSGRSAATRKEPKTFTVLKPKITVVKEHALDASAYERFLEANPMTELGRQYLNQRKITNRTIAAFNLGYVADAAASLHTLLRDVGASAAERAGLLSNRHGKVRLVFPSPSILFPFYDGGRVAYLQARATGNSSHVRWMGLNGVSKPIYNTDAIARAHEIYICEGCMDVLSAYELGRTSIGLTGAATILPDQVVRALRNKVVYIVADNDAAGANMAKETLSTLRHVGIQTVVQSLPRGKDLNDYLVLSRSRP